MESRVLDTNKTILKKIIQKLKNKAKENKEKDMRKFMSLTRGIECAERIICMQVLQDKKPLMILVFEVQTKRYLMSNYETSPPFLECHVRKVGPLNTNMTCRDLIGLSFTGVTNCVILSLV